MYFVQRKGADKLIGWHRVYSKMAQIIFNDNMWHNDYTDIKMKTRSQRCGLSFLYRRLVSRDFVYGTDREGLNVQLSKQYDRAWLLQGQRNCCLLFFRSASGWRSRLVSQISSTNLFGSSVLVKSFWSSLWRLATWSRTIVVVRLRRDGGIDLLDSWM
jgi:hypothetical protein